MTTRILLTAAACMLIALASPASVSAQERLLASTIRRPNVALQYSDGAVAARSGVALSFDVTASTAVPGRAMHRVGSALMAIGVNTQIAGALGGFFGLIVPWGGCNDVCGGGPLNVALFSTGMVTAGLGLVAFFVGLGLDIRGRILRAAPRSSPLALTPTGLALTF